ncbi:MAG: hypothetical protein LBC82_03535 [Oscillospiraceae bacterium]|nr:hypothetical protein [Oscillospiraceae bacterium]
MIKSILNSIKAKRVAFDNPLKYEEFHKTERTNRNVNEIPKTLNEVKRG